MAAQTGSRPDLWQRAIDSLPPSTIKSLGPARTGKRDVALAALRTAEEKRQLSLKKQWRIKNPSNHDEIIVRDVLEKIIHWIRRFKEVGDQMVQFDPGHAALPWGVFRFLLQIAINETTVYSGMVEDLEMVARLMARFHDLERLYLLSPSAGDDQLSNALVKVYAAILEFLAKAVKFFGESTAKRLLKAPFRSVDEDGKEEILAKEAEVLKFATLADAQRLVNVETQVLRLADISIASQKAVQEQQYLDVLRWLSQVPYSRHHESHRETRVSGTGQWMFQHPDFLAWESASSCSLLLVHGIPGSGKTVLCSAIIGNFIKKVAPLAYFYCNASESEPERRTPEGVLRSLTRQLTLSQSPEPTIHSAVLALHSRLSDDARADGFEMMKPKISDCVELLLAALEDNPAILVIDALDEIDNPKRLVNSLDEIINKSRNVVKVFLTSRENPAIFTMLSSPQSIRITKNQNKADVRSFAVYAVTSAISDYELLAGSVTQATQERLVDALVSGAGEMFLWIKLQLLRLCSLEHEKDLIAALTSIATSTLEELYRAAYERIQQGGTVAQEIATQSFAWLLYAREPLTIDAFLSAIVAATQLEQTTVDNILAICRGFLYLDQQSRIFRFAHHSVQEFLQREAALEPSHAQSLLALSCLSLCNDPPDNKITKIEPTVRFYDYTVLYSGHHFSAAQPYRNSSALSQELSMFFFDQDEPSLSAKIWMDNVRVAHNSLPREHAQKPFMELVSNEQCSSLFPICTFGLWEILKSVAWPADIDWNERNDYGHTALYAASFFGHTKVVAFLLEQGADSNLECGRFGSALHCAAYRGHLAVVKLLLDYGTDIRLGGKFDNAIEAACRGNQEEVVVGIMESAEIMDQVQYASTLEVVSEAGFSTAMEKLQTHPYIHVAKPSKTLQMAIKLIVSGKVTSLKYMTRNSTLADFVPPGSIALSALHGREAMTTYLLDQGLDITEAGELGTPLRCASLNGHSSVCHLLISRGANVDGNERFGSALHAAAMRGQLHIVRLLLDAGANVNIRGGFYGTPLQAAAYQGYKEVVSLLVGAGADPQRSGFSKDAFHAAAEGGRLHIIELLLAMGCRLLEPIPVLLPAFSRAPPPPRNLLRASSLDRVRRMHEGRSRYGSRSESDNERSIGEDEVKKENCIDSANPTPQARAYKPAQSGRYDYADNHNYPLEAAAALGHLEVVCQVLVQHEFLNLSYDARKKALIAACKYGHREVADEIMSRMEEDDIPLREALQEAASHSHVPVVRMLLAHDCAAETQSDRMKATLISSIAGNEQAFHEVLTIAEKELPETDLKEILVHCLPEAAKADRADIVQEILTRNEAVDKKKLISILMDTCKNGKAAAAKCLFEAIPSGALLRTKFSEGVRLAVENGHFNVVHELFPFFRESGKAKYLRHMILVAAGRGHLDVLELLLDNAEAKTSELLQQALIIGAENGHDQVCAYLLSKGLEPCNPAPTVFWANISVRRRCFFEKDDIESASSSSDSEIEVPMANFRSDEGEDNGQSETDGDVDLLIAGWRPFNAVESCISGFKRFEPRRIFYAVALQGSWEQQGSQEAQISTLRLLLESAPSLEDPKWDEAICAAAKLCPPSLVAVMLDKGANSRARYRRWSALRFAVARECLSFPIMQALIEKGADIDIPKDELQRLLAKSASFFGEGKKGDLFVNTKSLEDVFVTGPGAVVKYLLLRLPEENIASEPYSVLLQCAAAAGQVDLVTLLLERQANVNWVGCYYGTALQAAARFEHASVVRLLLCARADPNIRQGRHHTALRAAVLGESLEAVNLLLKAGANTELSGNRSHRDEEDDPTPLQLAVGRKYMEIAQVLIEFGADVNAQRKRQQPLLIQACSIGDISLICALLEAGADLQTQGHKYPQWQSIKKKDISAIHAAIESGRVDVIKFLLSKGFRLSVDFAEVDAPLTFAAQKEDIGIIDTLLDSEPFVSDEILYKSLKRAVQCSNFTATRRFLYHRPSVLDIDKGISILKTACNQGNLQIVELLLEELSHRGRVESACTVALDNPPQWKAVVFEMILDYVPCTVDLFVEACVCGHDDIVKAGIKQGIHPSVVDGQGRPALHFAAIHGSDAVVELLLRSGADPNAQNLTYGMPLGAALGGYTAKKLASQKLPEDIQAHAQSLIGKFSHHDVFYSLRSQRFNILSYQKCQQYENVLQVLLAKGALPNPTRGPFGSSLALAAFIGIRSIFNEFFQRGATNTVGGYLHSPIAAAIAGGHLSIAREILKHTSDADKIGSVEEFALLTACQDTNLPAIKLLLHYGVKCHAKNDNGDTPLSISLANLVKRNFFSRSTNGGPREHMIVNLLLDAKNSILITEQDIIAATKIWDEYLRVKILHKMIPKAENAYFPEDVCIFLINHRLVQPLLDYKRIQRITTRMLSAINDLDTLTRLLDYDPAYLIIPETLDSVASSNGHCKRESVELLLQRDKSLIPSESNVLTVLKQSSFSLDRSVERSDKPHVLELIFSRNPQLRVAEDMLIAVTRPEDLKILLAHTSPEEGLLAHAVMAAMSGKRSTSEKLLEIILSFDHNIVIHPKIAERFIDLGGLDTLERLWKHDPNLPISEVVVLTLVNKVNKKMRRKNPHGDFIKLLREHKGQWHFTRRVRDAIDHKFHKQTDQDLKDLYHSVLLEYGELE